MKLVSLAARRKQLLSTYQFRVLCRALIVLFCLVGASAHAATRTWTGGHASSANWNLRDNWGGIAVPTHGDTLVFPSGAARIFNTNNIAGLRLAGIQFTGPAGGYNLRGLGVTLTNGITLIEGSDNTVSLDSLTLGGHQTVHIPAGGGLTVNSDIALNGFNLSLAAIGDISMRGAISGDGNVSKSGAGLLSLFGAKDNTFNGTLTVMSGTLAMNRFETTSIVPLTQVSRIAVPGNLVLGNGSGTVVATAHFDDQIANTSAITINENATLNLNGHDDTVAGLVLKGGTLHTGAGTLTPGSTVSSLSSADSAVINGQLFLGTSCTFSVADGSPAIDLDVRANIDGGIASIFKTGAGTLRFGGTNTYLGTTWVNGGQLNAGNDSALGTQNGTTVVAAGAQLLLEHGVDTLQEHLTLSGAGIGGTNAALRVAGSAVIEFSVTLNAPATINTPFGAGLGIEGVVSGTGPLTKIGGGTLQLAGGSANTFSGGLLAEDGLVLLSKLVGSAVQGDLTIGTTNTTATVRHTRSANLGGAVTVNGGSLYELDGNNESVDSLTFVGGGQVETGTGQLTVDTDITVLATAINYPDAIRIKGRLRLGNGSTATITVAPDLTPPNIYGSILFIEASISGSASIIKNGRGYLGLHSSNSFSGTFTVAEGNVGLADSHALGSDAGDTFVEGDSKISLNGDLEVRSERLFLNSTRTNTTLWEGHLTSYGSNTWAGPIFLAKTALVNTPSNGLLNVSGVINGLAGLTKFGDGTLIYSGTAANTYLGATRVNDGVLALARTGAGNLSIPGPLIIGDGVGMDIVKCVSDRSQINNQSPVTIHASGRLMLEGTAPAEGIGSLDGSGRAELNDQSLETGYNNVSTVFSGTISGDGEVKKYGTGTFTLTGANTYTGDTVVKQGTLVVNGLQPDSDVLVEPGTTLRGEGFVGYLSIGGTFAPGNPGGRMDATGVDFQPGSTFVTDLAGPNFTLGYGRFSSAGEVDLTGATLDVSLHYAPVSGEDFILGRNDSANPTTGLFAGLPEGSVIVRGQIPLHLSYAAGGGNNNDITLTVGELALRLGTVRVTSGNGNGVIDPNECNDLFVSIENPTAGGVIVLNAHLQSLDNQLIVTQGEAEYGTVPANGARTNQTPFQVRTSAGYSCGKPAEFHLVVSTLGHGRFAIPVTLNTGKPGELITFQAQDLPRLIPDNVPVFMPLEVTNNFRIARARVTIHTTHPSVGQLRFWLWSPGVNVIPLSDHRGGAGNNFGASCGARTTLDDNAPLSITAGVAPFVGLYRPEESLESLVGTPSAGTWQLYVLDDVAGSIGAVQCWSLELSPFECTDGGGACDTCVASVSGEINGSSPTMAERLLRVLPPSGCGDVQPCAGAVTLGTPPYHYGTHSFTNNGPETCVTVALNVPCTNVGSGLVGSAYLGDFNPGDLCANLIGGSGLDAVNGTGGFSFRVAAGARFTVVVNEHNNPDPFSGCGSYSLELYGLPCREAQPRLHIANDAGPDAVRLHWSTAYPGFDLQRTRSLTGLGAFAFTNITTAPVVIDGHYSVTNSHGGTNGFYRLRKP